MFQGLNLDRTPIPSLMLTQGSVSLRFMVLKQQQQHHQGLAGSTNIRVPLKSWGFRNSGLNHMCLRNTSDSDSR